MSVVDTVSVYLAYASVYILTSKVVQYGIILSLFALGGLNVWRAVKAGLNIHKEDRNLLMLILYFFEPFVFFCVGIWMFVIVFFGPDKV